MAQTTLTAPDISCDHCKQTIESGMGRARGVRSVEVEVDSRHVGIDYDEEETDEDALRDEMAELGYPVDD
jgi:copper chaperone